MPPARVPRLTLIPRAAQLEVAWRNQGGTTREVAAEPFGAGADQTFAWRVSIARVERDGPFSSFAGIDRTLWLLAGNGMQLDIDGRTVRLDTPLRPIAFAGEANVRVRLFDGPTEDLNVMVDRRAVDAQARVHDLRVGTIHTEELVPGAQTLLVVLHGALHSKAPGHDLGVPTGDAMLIDEIDGACAWQLHAPVAATVLLARFVAR